MRLLVLLIVVVWSCGLEPVMAESSLSDKEKMALGLTLLEDGQPQKAYDFFFKEVKNNPKYNDWISKFIEKHKIKTEDAKKNSQSTYSPRFKKNGAKWALIGLDIGLGFASALSVISHNRAVDDYQSLLLQIDNALEQNHWVLVSKWQEVQSKRNVAAALSIGAGVAIGYTLLDALLLHKVFSKNVALNIAAENLVVSMKIKF